MKIGETVLIHTNNLFSSYVIGFGNNGIALEVPVKMQGKVVEIDKKSKTGHTVKVQFTVPKLTAYWGAKPEEEQISVYMKPSTLKSVSQ